MLRRSFRSGLLAGVIAGLVIAVVRVLQSRRATYEPTFAPPSAWPPVTTPTEAAEPGMAAPQAATTTVEPEPLVPDAGAATAPAATAPGDGPGTITEEPAGRSQPLEAPWVECDGYEAPPTHPVKVKLSSGIFHVPGGLNYARCKPDRCYVSEEAATADGFTKAKR